MKDHDYQQLYDEVYKELVTPTMRAKLAKLVEHGSDPTIEDLRARLATVERERDEARDQLRVTEEQVEELGHMNESNVALANERDEARADVIAADERMVAVLDGTHALSAERDEARQLAHDRAVLWDQACEEREVLAAQFAAASATVSAECVEHVELNGHIETATFAHDYLLGERDKGDPSGRLHDFVVSLEVVIDQLDRQRRRANWHEAAHTAGKQKLIESAVAKALEAARAAAQVYAERVDALGLAADDNDPLVMATAEPIGAAQADLFAALGLLARDASGKVSAVDPTETVEQLRAERDTARTLAEVRARDIPASIADFVAKEGDDNCDGGWGRLYAERVRAGKWRTP